MLAAPQQLIACVRMMRAWGLPMLLALGGSIAAAGLIFTGQLGAAMVLIVVYLLFAAVISPLIFPRSVDNAEAQRLGALDGRPVVYWRPGCAFCLRLRVRLGRDARRMHWVNIWRDPAAAAAVRAVNDGNETVPTVVMAGSPYTNPDPAWVREQLRSAA
jgi:glutaredoxin